MIIVYCVPSPLCLRRIQSIFCFTLAGLLAAHHQAGAGWLPGFCYKDVIVLIKASKVGPDWEPYSAIVWLSFH